MGGILRYGIPDYKLEKKVIDRRCEQMKAEGVRFETDIVIGEDLSARYLKKSFDVVLLTLGAGEPRDLNIVGRGLEGIHFAMEFLTQSNQFVAGNIDKQITARNKNVLVIEDVTTSGGSVVKTIQVLRENNAEVDKVLVVVDRESGAKEKLQKLNVTFISLLSVSEFIKK